MNGQDTRPASTPTDTDDTISALCWALHDDTSRFILTRTTERARTVKELAALTDVSINTVYRRVRKLTDQDLLYENHRLTEDGYRFTAYRAAISKLEVELANETLETSVERTDAPSDRPRHLPETIRG